MKKKKMEIPKFKRHEKAGCGACIAMAPFNPAMVTFPCAVTLPGVAA